MIFRMNMPVPTMPDKQIPILSVWSTGINSRQAF